MSELVSGIRQLMRQMLKLRNLGELVAGAVVFYGCEAVFEFLVASSPNIPTRVLFLAFTVVPPFLLCLLTIWLYGWSRKQEYTIWPEINLLVGPVVFAPMYVVFASRVIYQPRPMVFAEMVREVFGLYLVFPLSAFSTMISTFGITPLMLSIFATAVTGWLLRRRARAGLSGRRSYPALSADVSETPSVAT